MRQRLVQRVRARHEPGWLPQIMIGTAAGAIAVAIRLALPLNPEQLPVLAVTVMLAIVTTFVGVRAGVTTAAVGGLASFYLFFNAYSWSLANEAWIPAIGFAVVAAVIIATAHLYRTSEQQRHDQEMMRLQSEVNSSLLFSREMAHRQKNTLAVVQAIAFQTFGRGSADAAKFAGRLRALAEANALLDEHVEKPSANVASVIEAALAPFRDGNNKFDIQIVDALIAAGEVLSLSLALHELATNALQHGALSDEYGRVLLEVQDLGDKLVMTWKEQGGREVKSTQIRGFGVRLLERSGTETKLVFAPDGLMYSMVLRKSLR